MGLLVYHVVLDKLLKEIGGHGSRIIVSKYSEISQCYRLSDLSVEVKYPNVID